LTFGLGKPEEGTTLTLEIAWPGGQKDRIADIKPNQSIVVQEGKGVISSEPIVFAPQKGTKDTKETKGT
jgi:hypothetical protein